MKKITITSLLLFTIILFLFFITIGKAFTGNIISGRIHLPREHIGDTLTMKDGQKFVVFRRLTVSGKSKDAGSFAIFKVRFKFNGLEPGTNKRLSMIPAPFLIGMKGFREKYWTINENTGYFQGIYQWESKEKAEKYPDSFIFKLMAKRSAPGTLSYEIIPNTDLSQYINELSSGQKRDKK